MKTAVLPPNCIVLKRLGWRIHEKLIIEEVKEPAIPDWNPIVVISNKKSGNGEGERILRTFRRLLNPIQVIDLSEVPPRVGLNLCKHLPNCKVLIAGGDGSVNWVLDAAERSSLKKLPPFCILPLGTGNDLSRTLGWGPGHSGPVDPQGILNRLRYSRIQTLDRWLITSVSSPVPGLANRGFKRTTARAKMSNYVSIGVDALVTFNFHHRRSRLPRILSGRLMNKFLFFHYGTRDVIERACKNMARHVTLYLDGQKVDLPPELEGIVFLNIFHWGAGVRPWSLGGGTGGSGDASGVVSRSSSTRSSASTPFGSPAFDANTTRPRRVTAAPNAATANASSAANALTASPTTPDYHDALSSLNPNPNSTEENPDTEEKSGAGGSSWAPLGPQSLNDERIEVFGLYSSFHIAQMQVGLSEPHRLGQARHVELVIHRGAGRLPMQADGEPWLQGRGTVRISHLGTVDMLAADPGAPVSPSSPQTGYFFL